MWAPLKVKDWFVGAHNAAGGTNSSQNSTKCCCSFLDYFSAKYATFEEISRMQPLLELKRWHYGVYVSHFVFVLSQTFNKVTGRIFFRSGRPFSSFFSVCPTSGNFRTLRFHRQVIISRSMSFNLILSPFEKGSCEIQKHGMNEKSLDIL